MKNLTNENIIHVKKDGVEFLQFIKLLEYSDRINHAYSLGLDKDFRTETIRHTKLDDKQEQNAIKCYKELTRVINSDYTHVVKSRQRHTKNVKCIKQKGEKPELYSEEYQDTDGLITNMPNVMLSTTNADCILLLFYDPVKNVIATLQRISVETVEKMQKEYNSDPKDIICCMCPSIRKCHFEVEQDVKEEFEKEFKELKKDEFIEELQPNKKWHIDTVYINKQILKEAGMQEKNIIDSKICSVCECDIVHSFRAEGENYGLATAIIEIK